MEYENALFQGTTKQLWHDTVFVSCDQPDDPPPPSPVTADPPPPSEQFTSISESFLERFETLEWGVGGSGVCGAYAPSRQSCLQPNDRARWERAVTQSCLGAPQVPRNFSGCYFRHLLKKKTFREIFFSFFFLGMLFQDDSCGACACHSGAYTSSLRPYTLVA